MVDNQGGVTPIDFTVTAATAGQNFDRCHKKIGTPIFRHPRSTNPRIYGTPIPIFLGLRDPTRDLPPENWNPRERTTVPGVHAQ